MTYAHAEAGRSSSGAMERICEMRVAIISQHTEQMGHEEGR